MCCFYDLLIYQQHPQTYIYSKDRTLSLEMHKQMGISNADDAAIEIDWRPE